MKLYVAGIDFNLSKIFSTDLHLQEKTKYIIDKLPSISEDAKKNLGDDAVIAIVLQEYAFAPQAIENKKKKECLAELQKAVNNYKNIILIPGTFAAYEDISSYTYEAKKVKLDKIAKNYISNLDNPAYNKSDPLFQQDYLQAREKVCNNSDEGTIALQNSGYILTAQSKKQKHKKSYTFNEDSILPQRLRAKSFFNIGADNFIKNITVNDQALQVAMTICREQLYINNQNIPMKALPHIQVIPSASITLTQNNLLAAVNIHMDSNSKLSVHVNDTHMHSNKITDIKAVCYYAVKLASGFTDFKKEVPINHFSHPMGIANKTKATKPSVSNVSAAAVSVITSSEGTKTPTAVDAKFQSTAVNAVLFNKSAAPKKSGLKDNFAGFAKGFLMS